MSRLLRPPLSVRKEAPWRKGLQNQATHIFQVESIPSRCLIKLCNIANIHSNLQKNIFKHFMTFSNLNQPISFSTLGATWKMSLCLDDTFGKVYIISQAFQCSLIIIIIIVTVLFNCSVIINISNCDIKSRIVSFVLIKNLCIVDLVGALLILPVPLAATIQGES